MSKLNISARNIAARKLVIFDFDGTLADTLDGIVEVAEQVLRDFGLAEERLVDCPRLVGPSFPDAFVEVFGLSLEDAKEVTARYRAVYNVRGLKNWPNFDGIQQMLAVLKNQGKYLAVASNKKDELVNLALEQEGIRDLFDVVRGKLSDENHKKSDAIQDVMDKLGFGPDDAIMVGDRHHDVDAAAQCDLPCIGVTYGRTAPAQELWDSGACAVCSSVDELQQLLLGD